MKSLSDITELANLIATDGISTVAPDRVRAIATAAVRRGASPVLAQVVVDPTQPDVARTRAFGRITTVFLSAGNPISLAA